MPLHTCGTALPYTYLSSRGCRVVHLKALIYQASMLHSSRLSFRHNLFAGLVNLSHIALKLLIDRCGDTLKHFVLQSSRISENVRCSAGLCGRFFQAFLCLFCEPAAAASAACSHVAMRARYRP